MSTLSVPLKPKMELEIERLVKSGYGANKADFVRKALEYFMEELAVTAVLQARQEVKEGKILTGNFKDLLKRV